MDTINPVPGQMYTAMQMYTELKLRDSPYLRVRLPGVREYVPVQTSHLTTMQLLTIPGFAESLWKYQYETKEWIPLFLLESVEAAKLFDYEKHWDETYETEIFWVTPKGFPRQYR